MQCDRCEWWKPKIDKGTQKGGNCHRKPPAILPWLAREQGAYDPVAVTATQSYESEWPETKANDFCGEFLIKRDL